jgi:hypothetical protein
MTELEFKIEVLFYTFNLQGEGRAVGKMIDDSSDTG